MLPYKIQSHRAADTKRSSGCSVNEQQPPKTLCSSLGFAHFVSLKVRPEKHLSNDINKLKKKFKKRFSDLTDSVLIKLADKWLLNLSSGCSCSTVHSINTCTCFIDTNKLGRTATVGKTKHLQLSALHTEICFSIFLFQLFHNQRLFTSLVFFFIIII